MTARYNLDLSYITDRIVAMSYPAENLESWYRNPIWQVQEFLDSTHSGHYKVYNLCSECQYASTHFDGRIELLPFDDHQVPPFKLVKLFCESVQAWLEADPENIAVVHCRAGKGRTGIMVCCYMVFTGMDPEEALNFYSEKRTTNSKGVTIASQQRYVHYWGNIIRSSARPPGIINIPEPKPRALRRMRLYDLSEERVDFVMDILDEKEGELYSARKEIARGQCLVSKRGMGKMGSLKSWLTRIPAYKDMDGGQQTPLVQSGERSPKWVVQMDTEKEFDPKRPFLSHLFDPPLMLSGNVSVTFHDKSGARLFFFWFNTTFIENGLLVLKANNLDRVGKGFTQKLGPDFTIELLFGMIQPNGINWVTGGGNGHLPYDSDLSGPLYT